MDPVENGQPSRLSNSQGVNSKICPYLGTCEDLQIRYSFPETLNCCHRISRPQRVALDHQGDVCLTENYPSCPVYPSGWNGPLPKELRGVYYQTQRMSRYGLTIGGVILALLIVGLFYFRWTASKVDLQPSMAAAAVLTRSVTPTVFPSNTPGIVFTPTEENPTLSPTPQITLTSTSTPTYAPPTPGPLENTPFGPNGRYLVHVVKEGELMEAIAKQYNTTPTVLKAINGLKPEAGFWLGVPMVISPGEVDVNNVFAMQAVWIAQPARVDVLAAKYATSEDNLRSFNGLGSEDMVPGGRWIVTRKK